MRRLNGLVHERLDVGRGARAARARDFAAVREHGERGDGPYPEAVAQLADRIGIDLHDQHAASLARGHFLQFGRDHPARPAPRGPEIDHDRYRCQGDEAIEVRRPGDLDRRGGWTHFVLARSASDRLAHSLVGNPVLLSALRARKNHAAVVELGFGHISLMNWVIG